MTTQKINVGYQANDNQGDPIRSAFQKCNSNFDQVDINTNSITSVSNQVSTNTSGISSLNVSVQEKAHDIEVLKKDGSVSLNEGYSPSSDLDLATKEYVDANKERIITNESSISANASNVALKANDVDVLKRDGSISLNAGYVPSSALQIATKDYVDSATTDIVSNTLNISLNTSDIADKANISEVLKKDGSVSLSAGYSPDSDLDISTKKYVDDAVSGLSGGSGASETDVLAISNGTEKFSDGVADINQSEWNIRAKSKIESNTNSLGSKATQGDLTSLTDRVTNTENKTTNNTNSINALSAVANSGSYHDLLNKPNIPAKTSDINNDSGFISDISGFNTDNLSEGAKNKYDKTVSINGGIDIEVIGTYPDFTVNSTTSGGSASPNMIAGGVLSNNTTNPDAVIDISACKCRSIDDTEDIKVLASSLDITLNSSWANGVVPNLANYTIHIWADYNVGNSRFVLDDAIGSNIGSEKRRVGSFIADVDGDIIPFVTFEVRGGGVYTEYYNSITQLPPPEGVGLLIFGGAPEGILIKLKIGAEVQQSGEGFAYLRLGSAGTAPKIFAYSQGESSNSDSEDSNISEYFTADGTLSYEYITNNGQSIWLNLIGYTDERI